MKITQTINFDKNNDFPGIDNALVVISDNTGTTDTLTNAGNGNYYTHTLAGAIGKTYYMYVKVGDKTFTATSLMPQPVNIDSLHSENAGAFGNALIFMIPTFKDPEKVANYYNFKIYVNNKMSKGIYCTDDAFFEGQKISLSLFPDGGPDGTNDEIKKGDSVTLALEMIDEQVYNYFFSLGETIGQNAASPSNPISNIKGGALGFFSAHAVTKRSIKIPE